MKITLFTSNQPRHHHLIKRLADISDDLFVVQEVHTIFPATRPDFYQQTSVMQEYFTHVIAAEEKVFGHIEFNPSGIQVLPVKSGDVSSIPLSWLNPALKSDLYVVFGASYIKGELAEFLVSQRALNIHMGASPYYRGSSSNFWALYDENPDLVAGTVHYITKGLDNGDILLHGVPPVKAVNPFELGMLAVKATQQGLFEYLSLNISNRPAALPQDASQEIRYTRHREFTDEIAREYLDRQLTSEQILSKLQKRSLDRFVNPFVL